MSDTIDAVSQGIDAPLRRVLDAVFEGSGYEALGVSARPFGGFATEDAEPALEFAALPGLSRASWLIPLARTACAAGSAATLTRSETARARLRKGALLATLRMGLGHFLLDRVFVRCPRTPAIAGLISAVTGERRPSFALLIGTPGPYRKVIVQAMRPSGEILGYIKIPLMEGSARRVRVEGRILEDLQRFPELRPHIPRVLHAGELGTRPALFLTPGLGPPAPARWTPMHDEFLRTLAKLQPTKRAGRALVSEVSERWRKAASRDARWSELGARALAQAERALQGVEIPCGIVHGDFVSHQMVVQERGLFVYDWEGAGFDRPIWWDYFHFHLGLLKNPPFRGLRGERACFLLYLLNVLAGYFEAGEYDADDDEFILLRRLLVQELGRRA